jgi:hypothetical protein
MAIQMIDRSDPRFPSDMPIGDDMLARQKLLHARRVDEREEFIKETVTVSTGIKGPGGRSTTADIVVRYPRSAQIIEHKDDLDNVVRRERIWTNGRFIFAVYNDNPAQHSMDRDVWEALARNAIEKFAAVHNANIIFGPRTEDTNRYNIMAECREAIQDAA